MHVSNQMNKESNNLQRVLEKIRNFISGPKIVFIILGIALLIEVVYAIRVLTSPTPSSLPVSKSVVQPGAVGKISLTVPQTDIRVNEIIPVSVMIDTGSHTVDGVDLIVSFDPKILEVTSGGLVKGSIFDEYPLMSLDPKKGLISISGISNFKNSFKGTGQFATINLRAKVSAKTSLTIDFNKGSATDSNLVETATSKDILEVVSNLELNII